MKLLGAIILFASSVAFSASAAVQAVTIHITTNSPYAVPPGKVLIIENIKQLGALRLLLVNGTNTLQLRATDFGGSVDATYPVPPPIMQLPLKISEGWSVQADIWFGNPSNPSVGADCWLFGLLADNADLFASISSRIDQVAVNGGVVSLSVQTSSPRPARIAIEKATAPNGLWQSASEASVTPTDDRTRYAVTLPAAGDQEFFRAKASAAK